MISSVKIVSHQSVGSKPGLDTCNLGQEYMGTFNDGDC